MRTYEDIIRHTFHFDTDDFVEKDGELYFHGVRLMPLIEQYGTPLRFSYLPKIGENIRNAQTLFTDAMKKVGYAGKYVYCYCTKSSHFNFVIEEALKEGVQIETSSAFDLDIIRNLHQKGKIDKDKIIINNGFKDDTYTQKIRETAAAGFRNIIPVLDNMQELDAYEESEVEHIGLRIATDEVPELEFYTSRLGIRAQDVLPYYQNRIKPHPRFKVKLLHFFNNSGMKDTVHFWTELNKFVYMYCKLRKVCPDLHILDIGGGFPIKTSLGFQYEYEYMAEAIIQNIADVCAEEDVPVPDIYTEFGSYTVGESGGMIFSVLKQKQQNDKEMWYMLDGSMITHLPDTWGMNQKFIMMAVNNWKKPYRQAHLGGRTCDSMDYYTSEMHVAKVLLPACRPEEKLYVGFFNTGAYQESLGGYGGIQHCLIPAARHLIIDRDASGEIRHGLFRQEQTSEDMLRILGYNEA